MSKSVIGLAVLVPVLLAGGAIASSAAAQSEPAAKSCKVTVDRKPELAGVYDVTRQEMANGDCICYVYTGPQPQSEAIESSIATLTQSGQCADAKPAAYAPEGSSVPSSSTGVDGTTAGVVLGVAVLGGGIAAIAGGGGGNDSNGG